MTLSPMRQTTVTKTGYEKDLNCFKKLEYTLQHCASQKHVSKKTYISAKLCYSTAMQPSVSPFNPSWKIVKSRVFSAINLQLKRYSPLAKVGSSKLNGLPV